MNYKYLIPQSPKSTAYHLGRPASSHKSLCRKLRNPIVVDAVPEGRTLCPVCAAASRIIEQLVTCPKCGGDDIRPNGYRIVAVGDVSKRVDAYRCRDCGRRWRAKYSTAGKRFRLPS